MIIKTVILGLQWNFFIDQKKDIFGFIMFMLFYFIAPNIIFSISALFKPAPKVDTSTKVYHVRGTEVFIDAGNSKESTIKAISKNRISFAGFVLPTDIEPKHFAAIGSTGTGKSTAIKELIFTSKKRNDRHIISDADGTYLEQFMNHDDVLLNPFDSRSAKWDYFGEIQNPSDFMFLASIIIPTSKKDDEWRKYARQLLSSSSEGWAKQKLGSSNEFFSFLISAKTYELGVLCKGTSAARFFEEGNEKMLGSILSTMAPFIEPLKYLSETEGELFSVRDWVRHGKGSLYLPYKANQLASLQSLISAWFSLAIYETLSLAPSDERKIWFVADELDAIGRIEGLKDALVRLRKFGGRVVLGFQSISQLNLVYGDLEANTIIENCGNKLILRCNVSEKGGTAEFASRLIGERDVEVLSYGWSNSSNGGSSSWSTSGRKESAILASEITQLKDLEGYLHVTHQEEWFKINFQPIDYQKI